MRSYENGRSMIEMLGVLAIIGVMSVGGMTGYNKVITQYRINKAIEQIEQMSSKLSSAGNDSTSYEGLDVKSAIKFNAAPSEAIDKTDAENPKLVNPFGGSIEIGPSNLIRGKSDYLAYTITYKGLDKDVCIALGSYNWHGSDSSTFIGLGIATNDLDTVKNYLYKKCPGEKGEGYAVACSQKEATVKVPLDPEDADGACKDCGNKACSIIFKYF